MIGIGSLHGLFLRREIKHDPNVSKFCRTDFQCRRPPGQINQTFRSTGRQAENSAARRAQGPVLFLYRIVRNALFVGTGRVAGVIPFYISAGASFPETER